MGKRSLFGSIFHKTNPIDGRKNENPAENRLVFSRMRERKKWTLPEFKNPG